VKGLTRIGLFEGMSDEELDALAARAHLRSFPANTVIVKEGEPADSLYIVLSGSVKVCLYEGDREVVLDTKGSGQYFGEMMLDDKPRSASIMTLEPCEFAVVPREDFKAFLLKHPPVSLHVIRNLIQVARGQNIKTREDVRTREDLRRYIEQLRTKNVTEDPGVKRWMNAKRVTLLVLLICAVLQYYFFDVLLEMLQVPSLTTFIGGG
jgi:CRP-like cAMP-binding protein